MDNKETFPLHRCIFRNDIESLNENLKNEEIKKLINQKDNHGNSPIHLALMLDRRNCILSLIKNGCDTISRNVFDWNPLEEATMLGDVDLIEKISNLKFRDYCRYFNEKGGKLDEWNETMPFLHYRAQVKFKSKIPLLDKIGIKDIIHFYKNKNSLRMDIGIAGIDMRGIPRVINGSLSIIVNRLSNGLSRIYVLDNKAKRYTEIFPYIPQHWQDIFIKSKTDIKTLYKFYVDNTDLIIKKKGSSNFGFKKNKKRVIRINGKKYYTDIFKFKNIGIVIRKRDNEQVIGDFKSDIKTTVADIDKSRNKTHSSLTTEFSNMIIFDSKLKSIEDIVKQEKELSENKGNESDSDSDDSDIDDDNKSVSSNGSNSSDEKSNKADNNFKKFIDENIHIMATLESEICDKVAQMIIKGQDEKGNTIGKDDILYIDQILPTFYNKYIQSKRLSDDDQKKFEEIINTSLNRKKDKDKNNREYIQNLKKSSNMSSMVHNIAENYYNSSYKKHSNNTTSSKLKDETIKRIKITEKEYFDPSNTESLHMGRVMEISEEKRRTKKPFKIWLTKENTFPLNADQLRPILDLFCAMIYDQVNITDEENNYDRNIYRNNVKYIFGAIESSKRFPLKFEMPVMSTTALQFKLLDLETEEKNVPDNKFTIPDNYIYDETVQFKFIK